jgi:hypothetical protein
VTTEATTKVKSEATTDVATDAAPDTTAASDADDDTLVTYRNPESDRGIVLVRPANHPTPQLRPSARHHARGLLARLMTELAGESITASDLKTFVYRSLCRDWGASPRPWYGKKGVAKYLGEIIEPRYVRIEGEDGKVHNVLVYDIPKVEKLSHSQIEKIRQWFADCQAEVVPLEQARRRRAGPTTLISP